MKPIEGKYKSDKLNLIDALIEIDELIFAKLYKNKKEDYLIEELKRNYGVMQIANTKTVSDYVRITDKKTKESIRIIYKQL